MNGAVGRDTRKGGAGDKKGRGLGTWARAWDGASDALDEKYSGARGHGIRVPHSQLASQPIPHRGQRADHGLVTTPPIGVALSDWERSHPLEVAVVGRGGVSY